MHRIAVDVGQAEIATGVIEGQLLVIKPKQVQDRGMPVVKVYRSVDRFGSHLVGGLTWLSPRLGHASAAAVLLATAGSVPGAGLRRLLLISRLPA